MIKLFCCISSIFLINVFALETEVIIRQLKAEEPDFPLDERKVQEELSSFRDMDRSSQLLEIKRKLMQTLGSVNDLYSGYGINSLQAKNEILGILRKVQNVPDDQNDAKHVFRQVSQNLDHLMKFIPRDVEIQKSYGNHKPELSKPEAEWLPINWKPPYGEGKPEGRPPYIPKPEYVPKPEYRPKPEYIPKPENGPRPEAPYYPVVYPEPEGKLTSLLGIILGCVKTLKACIIALL